jgi:hypothetical protein
VAQREMFPDDVKEEDKKRLLELHNDMSEPNLILQINTLKDTLMQEISQQNRDVVRKAPMTFRFMIEKIKLFFKVDSYGGKTCEDQIEKFHTLQGLSRPEKPHIGVVQSDVCVGSRDISHANPNVSKKTGQTSLVGQLGFDADARSERRSGRTLKK